MKSKIFCFNWTIYRKNFVLCWPIWAIYQVVLLLAFPVQFWGNIGFYMKHIAASASALEQHSAMMSYLMSALNSINYTGSIIAPVAAMATVIALFGFLFSQKNTNMMHAYPVTRGELFHTSLLSALSFMLIPELVTFIVTVLVCLMNQITCVQYVGMWFLVIAGVSVVYIALGVFAVMLTGHVFSSVVIFGALNLLYQFIRTILGYIFNIFSYGAIEYSIYTDQTYQAFSPVYYMDRGIRFSAKYMDEGKNRYIDFLTLEGEETIIGYVIAAGVLLLLAYLMYCRRPLEKAGDVVVYSFMKPVVRWGIGICAGYAVMVYLYGFFEEAGVIVKKPGIVCILIVSGVLAFGFAEMLIQKNFRILSRKLVKEGMLYLVTLLASFGVVMLAAGAVENYQPKSEDIESATIYLSYEIQEKDEHIEQIVAFQDEILKHAKEWKDAVKGSDEYTFVRIDYQLKNNSRVERAYRIPLTESGMALIAKISAYESETERFLHGFFGDYYDGGYFATGHLGKNYEEYEEFGEQTATALLEAIKLDAMDNTIQQYNLVAENGSWENTDTKYAGYIDFMIPNGNNASVSTTYDSFTGEYTEQIPLRSISFGTENTHLLRAMIDTGLIESEDELLLYDEYEEMQYGENKESSVQEMEEGTVVEIAE